MIISQGSNLKKSYLYLKMIDSITVDSDNNQLIKYKELKTNLDTLFKQQNPLFTERQFTRAAPKNGVCR